MSLAEHVRSVLHHSGFLPSLLLVVLIIALLLRARSMRWAIALLALPGTFAHELAHFIVGFILRGEPAGLSLLPRRSGNTWILGEVSFYRIGILNGAFIGLAPVALLPAGWLCLIHIALPAWVAGHRVVWILASYLTATVVFASAPSRTDLKVAAPSLIAYCAAFSLCWLAFPTVRSWVH
jgi:hypothetical protein